MLGSVLRAVLVKHALEDHHITRRHIDDLKTNVETVWVYVVCVTPLAAGNENHGILIGNIGCQFNVHPKILSGRDLLLAVQLEAACADIGEVAEQLLRYIVGDLHIVSEVTAVDFSLVCHRASFRSQV